MNWKPTMAWGGRQFLVTLLIVVAAGAIREMVFGGLGRGTPFLTYYPAVVLATLYGGFFSGCLATVLSAVLAFFWTQKGYMSPIEMLAAATFLVLCMIISMITEAMRRAQTRAALAQEKAEEANRAKSVFLANMSHELRTPMNAILGFSNLLRHDAAMSAGHRRTMEIINRSGEHLLDLLNNVLDMAKIEAGRTTLEKTPFNLHDMIRDIADMLRQQAESKGLVLTLEMAADLPRIIAADESKLRQTVINLVGNAIKFTEQGGVILRFSSRPLDEDGRVTLLVEIEDSGIGIAEEDLQRIFEPFVQIGSKTNQRGTGLGLPITRQFVELMGGSIRVESTLGKGSVFTVSVPVDLSEASEMAIETKKVGLARLAPGQPEFRILIVEDQQENSQLLRQLLEQAGFQVREAKNGVEGIEIFQSWRPHFIWMDWRMPVMDGIEATRRIRALDGGREVKIVALSASVFKEKFEQVLAAGADDFVPKPIQFDSIYACMAQHLGVRFAFDDKVPDSALQSPPESTLEKEESDGMDATILVVDDTADTLALMIQLLTKTCRQVRTATSGELALADVAANPPDLILLDIRMKGMDGLEVCRQLKARQETRQIPIILISGFASVNEWVEGLKLGAVDYITKPFQPEELLSRVRTHLALNRAKVELERRTVELRQTSDQVQSEILERRSLEQALARAEHSRQAMLSVLEDLKQAEEEQKKLRTAVEQSASTIVITDPRGNIEYVNPAFEKNTGYTAAEVVGQNSRVLKSGEQTAEFYHNLWMTILSGKIWQGEFHNKRRDGSLYWESATISPVLNDRGEIVHFIAVKENVTQRKAMEASLSEALIAAESAARAKSEFLAVMSHELRTPLNGVLGFAELLTYTSLDDEQKSYAETINKSGNHLLAIVNDILDFSSIEKGALAVHIESLAVADLVKSSEQAVRKSATDKGLTFRSEIDSGAPKQILGDEIRIRQILINLLGNAVKFTSSGTVVFRVSPDTGGRFLDFSVEDTGIGISSETMDILFKPFTQADTKMNRAFGGTGLGLAISQRLAKTMGGQITVVSNPGQGSTFTFHFPLKEPPPSTGETGVSSVPMQGGTVGTAPGGDLVLVVEDDPDNSMLAGKMVESLGYRAEFAAHGGEAVEAFAPGKYFAILMDIQMPVMNGLDATAQIRRLESGFHVPIIALTANVMPGDRERYLEPVRKESVFLKG